jgi:hypothetical protein
MGLLSAWFKSKPPAEDHTFEIIERCLSINERGYQVRVKKAGREFFAEELFRTAKKPGDLTYGRFFLQDERPPKPHFAPSLKDAVDWFRGIRHPKDGYGTIWWGDRVTFECSACKACRILPLQITKVERLTVESIAPTNQEIVGWRVAEVESELTGKGIPTCKLEEFKLKAVVIWYEKPNHYLCRTCAQKMTDAGRPPDPVDYFVFEG